MTIAQKIELKEVSIKEAKVKGKIEERIIHKWSMFAITIGGVIFFLIMVYKILFG